MLKQRILAAAVLIPAFLAAMFLLDGPAFAAVMGAVVLLASWEWTRLAAIPIPVSQAVYIATMALAMWLLWVSPARIDLWHWLLIAALLWWSLVLLWIVRHRSDGGPGLPSLLKLNAGYLVLLPAWVALVSLHTERGPYWLLFLLVVVWVADSGAYFVGKAWGRRKLAPGISPGKSIEGVYGGMLASVIPALGFGWALGFRASELLALVLLTVLCAAFSVVGDLFESLLKRQANMKDSSHLIPGHGGVLDRIDSVTAAAPWFVMGLSWIAGGGT
ncbi:MAG: phosphatidate cytidylyltransferase [Chromatiales bacterium]|nr:phosphatidate cytidylyltransferase [Chromatiales bacterium]